MSGPVLAPVRATHASERVAITLREGATPEEFAQAVGFLVEQGNMANRERLAEILARPQAGPVRP